MQTYCSAAEVPPSCVDAAVRHDDAAVRASWKYQSVPSATAGCADIGTRVSVTWKMARS